MVEASLESWTLHGEGQFRILDRARWRQVQDPGPCTVKASLESWTVHGGGQCKNPGPCTVEASARSWTMHRDWAAEYGAREASVD